MPHPLTLPTLQWLPHHDAVSILVEVMLYHPRPLLICFHGCRHDATAGFSKQLSDVARDLTYPLFANEVLTVDEWIAGQEAAGTKI